MQILMLLEMLCGFTILSHSSIFLVLGSSPSGNTFYTFCEAAPNKIIPRNESRFAPRSRGIKTGHIGHRWPHILPLRADFAPVQWKLIRNGCSKRCS